MGNPFRIKKKKKLKELQDLALMTAIFEKLSRRGVIFWRKKDNILIIEEYFAILKLAEGRDGFLKFLNQVATWQNNILIQEAYAARCLTVETEAVRKAQRKFALLTKADIQRIRQNTRDNMSVIPPEQLDCIKEFDIFVVRASAPSAQDATEESGQLLALGHYDGEKVEMAMYDEVKHNLINSNDD